MSAELEARANLLRKEALQSLTIALAGSDTKQLWDLLSAYFGANHLPGEEEDPWDFLDAAPEIPPPLPLTDTDSDEDKVSTTSFATTQSAPAAPASASSIGVGAKAKSRPKIPVLKDHLDDLCSPSEAIRIYPRDSKTLSETGIPEHLFVQRQQITTGKGGSLYLCRHELCQDPAYYAQSPAGLYSHVRRKHLGMVVACPYCPKKLYWNTKGWNTHMEKYHKDVPHYSTQLADESAIATALLSKVKEDPESLQVEARKQEKRLRKGLHPIKKESSMVEKGSVPVTPPKPEESSSDSDDADYQPLSSTANSSSDSPSDSSSRSDDADKSESQPRQKITKTSKPEPERESLTLDQLQAIHEGATALHGQPTLEALMRHPSAWKQPVPTHTAMRDKPPSATPAAQLASAMIMADVPPESGASVHLLDMPKLEETPPRPFPKRRKTDPE